MKSYLTLIIVFLLVSCGESSSQNFDDDMTSNDVKMNSADGKADSNSSQPSTNSNINENKKAKLLHSESFDGAKISSNSYLDVDKSHYTPDTEHELFVVAPSIDSYALHYRTQANTNEHAPTYVGINDFNKVIGKPDIEEIFISWSEYIEPGYCWAQGSQKLFRLGFNQGETADKKEINLMSTLGNSYLSMSFFCGQWGDSSKCSVDKAFDASSAFPEGVWVKWSYWVKLNTPGKSNGFVRVYKNDKMFIDSGSANIRGNTRNGLDYFWIGGNYTAGNGKNLECSGSRYIDDIKVYNTKP